MDRSDKVPSGAEIKRITKAIQDVIKQHFAKSDEAELTVNNIRAKVEAALKLEHDVLRTDPFWKIESKKLIKEEFEKLNDAVEEEQTVPAQPEAEPNSPKPSEEDEPPKKLARGQGGDKKAGGENEELSEVEDAPKKKRGRARVGQSKGRPAKKDAPSKPLKTEQYTPEETISEEEIVKDASESEMSEVIDITPKKKKQRLSNGTAKAKSGSKAVSKASAKPRATKRAKEEKETPVDLDADKIKELQGWLVKCGVRKVWGKELAKFPTAKEKIVHLRQMLTDVGMTGRFSNEKAKKIKEERELAEELKAVQAGAEMWGTGDSGTMKTRASRAAEAPPKTRRLVRPPELAFLDDQSDDSD